VTQTARPTAEELNDTIRYTGWTVFKRTGEAAFDRDAAVKELQTLMETHAADDVIFHGIYDISVMRGEVDLLLWVHAPDAEQIQHALRAFRRTAAGSALTQTWSAIGVHRPAEFSRTHVPAFMMGHQPKRWMTIYPFTRSYDWYLIPEEERREMLMEHGLKGREFPEVQSNTVASFALNDYEWLLCLEADELHSLVDMMRHLRNTKARMHVREEIPFFTGRLVDAAGAVEVLV
jgi:hydrogen peroxide-dependent heme synthase